MPNRTILNSALPSRSHLRAALTGAPSGSAPILIAAVLWGTTGTASSLAPAGAVPAAIGCAGLVLGGLLLFLTSQGAWSLLSRCERSHRWLLLLGALAVAGYPITFYPAVQRTGVAVATVIALGSAPVFTGLLAWVASGVRPTVQWAAATTAAVLGCGLLVLGPRLGQHAAPTDVMGVALAAGAGLSYAAYSLLGAKIINWGHSSDSVFGVMFGAAAVLVLPVVLFYDTEWLGTVRGTAVALHLAVFTVYLAYRLFGHGLRHTSAATATTLTLAEPAVAALLGVTMLSERLAVVSWYGLAVLASGLAVLTVPVKAGRPLR
jgi:DME family drug/metabolite transporter